MRRFASRNALYLRVSASAAVHTVLYLDQRHVRWMNENKHVFEHIINDLIRPQCVAADQHCGPLMAHRPVAPRSARDGAPQCNGIYV